MSLAHALPRRFVAAAVALALATATALTFSAQRAEAQSAGSCTPLDLGFVVDVTGSMGGALTNVKSGLNTIINEANTVASGNLRLGLVTFEDTVFVRNVFADNNEAAVKASINALGPGGGGSLPEASDEALNTVVTAKRASDRAAGQQTGDFQPPYRSSAEKIAVIITDAVPGGFDDSFTAADRANAHNVALAAKSRGVRISAINVPTGGVPDPDVTAILKDYATTSGGEYRQTQPNGDGTASAIRATVASCGGKPSVRRLKVVASRRTITAGRRTCVTFTVTNRKTKRRIRRALVSFGGKSARTNRRGRVRLCVRLGRLGRRGVSARRGGYRGARTAVFVVRGPRFTG